MPAQHGVRQYSVPAHPCIPPQALLSILRGMRTPELEDMQTSGTATALEERGLWVLAWTLVSIWTKYPHYAASSSILSTDY